MKESLARVMAWAKKNPALAAVLVAAVVVAAYLAVKKGAGSGVTAESEASEEGGSGLSGLPEDVQNGEFLSGLPAFPSPEYYSPGYAESSGSFSLAADSSQAEIIDLGWFEDAEIPIPEGDAGAVISGIDLSKVESSVTATPSLTRELSEAVTPGEGTVLGVKTPNLSLVSMPFESGAGVTPATGEYIMRAKEEKKAGAPGLFSQLWDAIQGSFKTPTGTVKATSYAAGVTGSASVTPSGSVAALQSSVTSGQGARTSPGASIPSTMVARSVSLAKAASSLSPATPGAARAQAAAEVAKAKAAPKKPQPTVQKSLGAQRRAEW